jgi:hypothetical protein
MPQIMMRLLKEDLDGIENLEHILKMMKHYDKENMLSDEIYRDYRSKIVSNVEKIFNLKFQVTR